MSDCATHRTIILAEGRRAELMCECGKVLRGTFKGAVFIEDEGREPDAT